MARFGKMVLILLGLQSEKFDSVEVRILQGLAWKSDGEGAGQLCYRRCCERRGERSVRGRTLRET